MFFILAAAIVSMNNGLENQHGHIIGDVTASINAAYYVIEIYDVYGGTVSVTYDPDYLNGGGLPGSYFSGDCLVGRNPYRVRCSLYGSGSLAPLAVQVVTDIDVPGGNNNIRVDFSF